ncbi:MAG: hypothetical protein KA138_09885 [Saprospiraceae bacterium]|jgi:hypothetical protein|nr:hypothetical protein [Saprospiraceae bacterium]
MANITRKIFNYFALGLSTRPGLLLLLLLVWGSAYLFGLLEYLGRCNGLPLFGWDAGQTKYFMGVIVLFILVLIIWRIACLNTILHKALLRDYTIQYGHRPNLEQIDWPDGTLLPGGLIDKLLAIIRISPHALLLLNATLLVAAVVLKTCWELVSDAPAHTFGRFVFVNMPWSISLLVATVLIYSEISVLDRLVEHFRISDQEEEETKKGQLSEFLQMLTAMESQLFQKKFIENQRNKTVASYLNISESTVKTHVNNINRKWNSFSQIKGLKVPLKAFNSGQTS